MLSIPHIQVHVCPSDSTQPTLEPHDYALVYKNLGKQVLVRPLPSRTFCIPTVPREYEELANNYRSQAQQRLYGTEQINHHDFVDADLNAT
jgi:hypothetical protein